MYFRRKLRSPEMNPENYIGIAFGICCIILWILLGMEVAFGFVAIGIFCFAFVPLFSFLRTKNTGFLVLTTMFFLEVIYTSMIALGGQYKFRQLTIVAGVVFLFAVGVTLYFIFTRRLKWRSREIFELAAMPVSETSNGFTGRPIHAGKLNYSQIELRAFAEFMLNNLIAIPYFEENRVVFSLDHSISRIVGLKQEHEPGSWISFDNDGNVTAHISAKDYVKFKDTFAFDKLCTNLGVLFAGFMEKFLKGEGVRVIDKLNDLRLNPFTE